MIFWNTRRVNKLRKSQRCEYCDRRLEPGTSAMYHSGLFGGEFISYYLCDWCDNHIAEIEAPDGGSYEFKSGGLWNAVINGHCDIKCPQCGETELEVKDYNTALGTVGFECEICSHYEDMSLAEWLGLESENGQEQD